MKNNSPNGGRPQKPRATSARQKDSTSNENRKDSSANPEKPIKGKPRVFSKPNPRFQKSEEASGRPKAVTNPRSKKYKPENEEKGPKAAYAGKSEGKDGRKAPVRKGFSKSAESAGEKPTRFKPNDKTYRERKPTKATEIGDEEVSLSKIVGSKGLHARGKKKEYTSKVQKTVVAPEYDFKKMSQLSKAKSKGKLDTDIRLNRYISNAGICSRRDADLLIQMGEIKVNGKIVTEMGYQVKQGDEVRYGTKILNREKKVYVLLNKPKDFITTTDDPQERRTVMQLVANAGKERIYPVGRLDRNTTGLLLMTNDGELSMKLAHPTHKIKKIYMVELDKPITPIDFEKVRNGLHLEDGIAQVDDLALIGNTRTFLGIEIHIGRNRIVRRIFESLGYDVKALDRVMYAGLTKKDLPRGTWRYLTEKEVISLKFF